jgi:TPR repeat protein
MQRTAKWHAESKRLAGEQDRDGELRVLVAAGRRGSLEAAATFARKAWGRLPDEHCIEVLEEVERRVRDRDWATHFALHLAYVIGVGAGVRDFEELMRRAFDHLKKAALARKDAGMFFEVGLHYWHGLNMVPREPSKAGWWLEVAASSGDPLMAREYRRFLRTTQSRPARDAA